MARCPTCARRLGVGTTCPADGGASPPVEPDAGEPAPGVPGYVVGQRIGRGGFASVFEAVDADGEEVAIKVAQGATAALEARFRREAGLLRLIGAGPVPAVFADGTLADGRPYIVMERLEGESLADSLAGLEGAPSLDWVSRVGGAVAIALEGLHELEVVHGDLKPENVFLRQGRATLIDFGLATGAGARALGRVTVAGEVAGTPEYMAPEQHASAVLDARSDIYALGVLLYELATLRVPFTGTMAATAHGHRARRPPRPRLFRPLPMALEELILSCLAKQPERRPSSLAEIRARLEQACAPGLEATSIVSAASAEPMVARRVAPTPPSRRAVVLLGVAGDLDIDTLTQHVERGGGILARELEGVVVAAFLEDRGNPVERALGTAINLLDRGGVRVCAHVAELRVRASRRGVQLYGEALEAATSWLPTTPWSGLLVTPALGEMVSRPLEEASEHAGFYREAAVVAGDRGLVGRDPMLEQIMKAVTSARELSRAALVTVVGAGGLGKSALLDAAVARVAGQLAEANVVRLEARRAGGDPRALRVRLGAGLAGHTGNIDATSTDSPTALAEALVAAARFKPLIVAVDDAHACDDALLDAIELATLDGVDAALVVIMAAGPELEALRPAWGRRARYPCRVELSPLTTEETMELAARLLAPVQYPARELLERLARSTDGVPALLCDVTRTLRREGFVRRDRATGTWRLVDAALGALPASHSGHWMARQELDRLAPELAWFATVCATLGERFERAEVEAVIERAELDGEVVAPLAVEAGLTGLADCGLVTYSARGDVHFAGVGLQAALMELAPEDERQRVHAYALAHHQGKETARALAGVARHARALGQRSLAVAAYRKLADMSGAAHRYYEAEQQLSAALELVEGQDILERAELLLARSRVRYPLQRSDDAMTDLRAAEELADELGNPALAVEIVLEQSIALDWAWDFAEAKRVAGLAQDRARECEQVSPRLAARLQLARGRVAWRDAQVDDAARELRVACDMGEAAGDEDTALVARMMLAPALSFAGELDASEVCFVELMAACRRTNDRAHLAGAYCNRLFLWSARENVPAALQDLGRAISIAREIGNSTLERAATYNLAEMLFHLARDTEALELAERSRRLNDRFIRSAGCEDLLLIVRILAAMGRDDEARAQLRTIAKPDPAQPAAHVFYRIFAHELGIATDDWDQILGCARETLEGEELLEVFYWRQRAAHAAGESARALEVDAEARALLPSAPILRARFDALAEG